MRCMVMRLTEKESLDYFKEQGYQISCRQFYRIKKNIKESRFERLSEIAKGFIDRVSCLTKNPNYIVKM